MRKIISYSKNELPSKRLGRHFIIYIKTIM